jgi:hypothetical protein
VEDATGADSARLVSPFESSFLRHMRNDSRDVSSYVFTSATPTNADKFSCLLISCFIFFSLFAFSAQQLQRFIAPFACTLSIEALPEFVGRRRQCPQKSTIFLQGELSLLFLSMNKLLSDALEGEPNGKESAQQILIKVKRSFHYST